MSATLLDQLLASPGPFDDVFDGELLPCGPSIEPLAIWTHCGRRIDLEAPRPAPRQQRRRGGVERHR